MGLANTVGAGSTIELGGERLQVSPRILRHYAEIEAEIIERRGDPFDSIRKNKDIFADSPELLDRFVEKAFDQAKTIREVSLHDIGIYISETWHGQLFAIWLAVRDNNREVWTLDKFVQVFSDEYEERIRVGGEEEARRWMGGIEGTIDKASGEDELGNSTGSPQSTPPEGGPAAPTTKENP